MKRILYIFLAIALLLAVRSPKAERFVVPAGGAAVYSAPGDSLPAYRMTEGDTVALKLSDGTYSTFRKDSHTWYMKRSDLTPLYWMGKVEHAEQKWFDQLAAHYTLNLKTDGKTLPLFFLGISLMGAGTLWLLRKRRNQSFAPFVAAPVLLASAAAATLQLTVDDPVWFCWPSVVGWPLTIVNFVLFAACTVAQVYLLRQTFRACMASDRRNSFQPTFLLPALAACIFIACLLLYPIASAWADIRILQHLTYGIPLLLLVIYVLYMAGKLLFSVRCSPAQKLAALVAGVSAMITLVVLGMMALSILFYIILVAAGFLVLSGFSSETATAQPGGNQAPRDTTRWHSCASCPYRYTRKTDSGVQQLCRRTGQTYATGGCRY